MGTKSTKEILEFYSNKNVVDIYDKTRFSGIGGRYVDMMETKSILENVSGSNTLELGSGTGRLTTFLASRAKSVTCLDSSKKMLTSLKKRIKKVKLLHQSVFDLIKDGNRYDLITALRFFDHFSIKDQDRILRNITSKLSKEGHIVYSALNRNSIESYLSVFFYYSKTNYFYSYDSYLKLFGKNNLAVERVKTDFFLPRGLYLRFKSGGFLFNMLKNFDKFMIRNFNKSGALFTFILSK